MKKIAIVLLVSLAGCSNTPERQADRITLRHGSFCEQKFKFETNEWRDCVLEREKERLQRMAGTCRNDGAKISCTRPRAGDL